jgi:hypothetical protein
MVADIARLIGEDSSNFGLLELLNIASDAERIPISGLSTI